MAKKLPQITLKIAGATYPFKDIDADQEEIYRRAEREVNAHFAQSAHPTLLPKDQLALTALHFAMENIRLNASRSLGEDFDRIAALNAEIEQHLGNK